MLVLLVLLADRFFFYYPGTYWLYYTRERRLSYSSAIEEWLKKFVALYLALNLYWMSLD